VRERGRPERIDVVHLEGFVRERTKAEFLREKG